MGKVAVLLILAACIAGGVGIWYTQQRAFWEPVEGPITLTLETDDGPMPITAGGISAIRSTSSPLGFRACFGHSEDLSTLEGLEPPEGAPTVAPAWFECFDADAIGNLIEVGEAETFLAYRDAAFGVDRVIALGSDGRGWAWHELNECGDRDYSGTPVGRECPDRADFEPLVEGR